MIPSALGIIGLFKKTKIIPLEFEGLKNYTPLKTCTYTIISIYQKEDLQNRRITKKSL